MEIHVFRPGAQNIRKGVQIFEPRAAELPWWNPDGTTPAANTGAWLAKGAASQAASYLNFGSLGNANIDPAVVGGVAPTWASGSGWAFNGSSQYLIAGLVATEGWSALVQYSGVSVLGTRMLFGANSGSDTRFYIAPAYGAGLVLYGYGGSRTVSPNLNSGNLGLSNQQGYRNGAADGITIGAWSAANTQAVYIGAHNNNGAVAHYLTGTIIAIAFYNVVLTAPQVLARATAMAAL